MKSLFKLVLVFCLIVSSCLLMQACTTQTVVKTPYIGENGNWWVDSTDLGVSAQGPQGEKGETGETGPQGEKGDKGDTGTNSPYIGENGNWWVGNVDLGVSAQGPKGEIGQQGETGETGPQGEKGETGETGPQGSSITVVSVEKIKSEGLVDTYQITFSDSSTTTFTVTNGQTPYVGENGNWWIGEEDTGISVYPEKAEVDEREDVTDGLVFVSTTICGKAGMVVADYVGSNREIIIPNYVGSVPVIGVYADAFKTTNITSISLSKNTIYLDSYCFSGCSSLAEIDFNGCNLEVISAYCFQNTKLTSVCLPKTVKSIGEYAFYNCTQLAEIDFNDSVITEVPTRCFYNTVLSEVTLPSTVSKLGEYAFYGVVLDEINYQNVKHFGDYSLSHYVGRYVYLDSSVEFVGSNAFSTFVYIEHSAIPTIWESYVDGNYSDNKTVMTNCLKNDEYIYSKSLNGVTVYQYLSNSKKISIPSAIENLPVTKIGYGFASLTEAVVEILYDINRFDEDDPSTYKNVQLFEEVKIPSSVSKIEYYTFVSDNIMIFIPSSVDVTWKGIGGGIIIPSYLAFESTTYPTFKSEFLDTSSSISESSWLSSYADKYRIGLGVNPSVVEYEEKSKTYYVKDSSGYQMLALMDAESANVTISTTFNDLTVHTIRPDAISGLKNLKSVKIANGIKKIQGKAFDNLSLKVVLIPSSVTTINAYGFDNVCNTFVSSHLAKPDEWDSYWAGSNTSSVTCAFGVSVEYLGITSDIIYSVVGNEVWLIKYYGTSNYIYIPRSIEGKTVTTIQSSFIIGSGTKYVYLPKEITVIYENAFVNSSYSNFYFYCEGSVAPITWNSQFYYNSYYGNSTSCVTKNFSQTLNY